MKLFVALLAAFAIAPVVQPQDVKRDIPYAAPALERQVLDIYAPKDAKNLPVVFWIHGGGWQSGDKSSVQEKPKAFVERGFVFVSTNYRLLPKVEMETIFRDVAKSLGWVHQHIAEHGGDPSRLFVMGHSAGAQLAALLCIDDRYLKAVVLVNQNAAEENANRVEVPLFAAQVLTARGFVEDGVSLLIEARQAFPDAVEPWLTLAQLRGSGRKESDLAAARMILDEAEQQLGDVVELRVARLFVIPLELTFVLALRNR